MADKNNPFEGQDEKIEETTQVEPTEATEQAEGEPSVTTGTVTPDAAMEEAIKKMADSAEKTAKVVVEKAEVFVEKAGEKAEELAAKASVTKEKLEETTVKVAQKTKAAAKKTSDTVQQVAKDVQSGELHANVKLHNAQKRARTYEKKQNEPMTSREARMHDFAEGVDTAAKNAAYHAKQAANSTKQRAQRILKDTEAVVSKTGEVAKDWFKLAGSVMAEGVRVVSDRIKEEQDKRKKE